MIFVTGCPGSGKTLLLKSMAERSVPDHINNFYYSDLDELPVRMSLHDTSDMYHHCLLLIDEPGPYFRNVSPCTDIKGFFESHCAYGIDVIMSFQLLSNVPDWIFPDKFFQYEMSSPYSSFFRRFLFKFRILTYNSRQCCFDGGRLHVSKVKSRFHRLSPGSFNGSHKSLFTF